MSLAEEFNAAHPQGEEYDKIKFEMYSSGMSLYVRCRSGERYIYNFLTRILSVGSSSSEGGFAALPFSQLDCEVLEFMRDKLIEIGGKPPRLAEKPTPRSLIDKNTP